MVELDKTTVAKERNSNFAEESQLEKFGVWATTAIDRSNSVTVVPRSDARKLSGPQSSIDSGCPILRILDDGSVVRTSGSCSDSNYKSEHNKAKELLVEYNEKDMNFQKLQTLYQIATYTRKSGKGFDVKGSAIYPLVAASLIGDRFSPMQTYQYEISPGISRLPEGLLAPTRVVQAIRRAEIEAGFNIDVTSAIRSEKEQDSLFKKLNGIQSVAPPGTSYHDIRRGGIAIDVDNWKEAKPFLERRGFMHGEPGVGELWNDPWHFVYIYKGEK